MNTDFWRGFEVVRHITHLDGRQSREDVAHECEALVVVGMGSTKAGTPLRNAVDEDDAGTIVAGKDMWLVLVNSRIRVHEHTSIVPIVGVAKVVVGCGVIVVQLLSREVLLAESTGRTGRSSSRSSGRNRTWNSSHSVVVCRLGPERNGFQGRSTKAQSMIQSDPQERMESTAKEWNQWPML